MLLWLFFSCCCCLVLRPSHKHAHASCGAMRERWKSGREKGLSALWLPSPGTNNFVCCVYETHIKKYDTREKSVILGYVHVQQTERKDSSMIQTCFFCSFLRRKQFPFQLRARKNSSIFVFVFVIFSITRWRYLCVPWKSLIVF